MCNVIAMLWGPKNEMIASAFKKLIVLGEMERQLQQSIISAMILKRAQRSKGAKRSPSARQEESGMLLEKTRFKFSRINRN